MLLDRERSRSRSRSRDRENFSESVWDRSEVEGPSDRDKERDKRDKERHYEMSQLQRERESHKVYHPSNRNFEKEKSKSTTPTERATFKTHMVSKNALERERKSSVSTLASNKDKYDDMEMIVDDFVTPASIPAPVLAPPMLKNAALACLTYNRVAWKLRVRKEVFRPNESIGPPTALDLLFAQVAADIFGITPCLRITPHEKRQALSLMSTHGITLENVQGQVRTIVKRHLVDMARGWPLYFARLFVVSGSPQFPDICILAISHNGIFLARKDQEYLSVVKSLTFNDVQNAVTLPRPAALQLNLKNGNRYALHATRAQNIQHMVQSFLQEFKIVSIKSFIMRYSVKFYSFLLLRIHKL